jgi:hypothetical protein
MSAGTLTPVELLRTEPCKTPSWPIHEWEVYRIGNLTVGICQTCAALSHRVRP